MPRLLVVHHTPGSATRDLLAAVLAGTAHPELSDVTVETSEALHTTPAQVLAADGYLLLTPANLGSMAGALKHFFDTTYPAALDVTARRPYALIVRGETDTSGAIDAVHRIVTGLRWTAVGPPLSVVGPVEEDDRAAATELAGVIAATVLGL